MANFFKDFREMPSSIVHCLLGPTCPPGSPYSACRALLSALDALVDEVDAEEMQDQAANDVVGECSVARVRRDAAMGYQGEQTSRETLKGNRSCWTGWSELAMKLGTTSASLPLSLNPHTNNIPVRTNCPTVAEKPDRKALKGCALVSIRCVSRDAPGEPT